MNLSLTDVKDIATIIGVIVAVGTLFKAVLEYIQQGVQKRAQSYFEIERKFLEDKEPREICILLDSDDINLSKIQGNSSFSFWVFMSR